MARSVSHTILPSSMDRSLCYLLLAVGGTMTQSQSSKKLTLIVYTVLQNRPNISAEGNWQDNTTASSNTTSSLYQVLMIDLSLPASRLAGVDPALIAPGAGENRTTRLHWWAGNLTSTSFEGMESNTTYPFASFLVSNDTPVASYQGPGPPEGDSAHYYVFYLFEQPENFTLPANAASGNYSGYLDGRINFNVTPVIEAAGQPLAATYLLAQANATGITNATMA